MDNITHPAPLFNVGDRVRVIGDGKDDNSFEHFFKIGTQGEVVEYGAYMELFAQHTYKVQARLSNGFTAHQWIGESDLEKVER